MTKHKDYKYKFSIVMAVYNVEDYIEEAIESLINQENIDFIKDVQVILVNDGSPDNSEEICLKYKQLYPDNVVYIKKENGGVSSARNKGLKYVEGKYINFLDPDDMLKSNALSEIFNFFECNYKLIDVVTIPLYFFGATEGSHQLNRKFKSNRIINILSEPTCILYSSSSSFIKYDSILEMQFNKNLNYAEDAELINKIILKRCAYGAVGNTKYLYRKRGDGTSAIDKSGSDKTWYIEYFKNFSISIINHTISTKGYLLKYIQHLVMHDLQWRIKIREFDRNLFNEEEIEEIIKYIKIILNYIDDDVILKINMKVWYKIFCLELKYEKNSNELIKLYKLKDTIKMYKNDDFIFDIKNSVLAIQNVDIQNESLIIEGYTEIPLDSLQYEIVAYNNSNLYNSEKFDRKDKDIIALNKKILDRKGFKFKIPIENKLKSNEIKLYIKINETLIRPKIWIDKYVRLYSFMKRSFFIKDNYSVVYVHNTFTILKKSLKVNYGLEYRFNRELIKRKEYNIVLVRIFAKLLKKIKRNKIWVFMDRVNKADDNAEHLFRYCNNIDDGIKKYFIIDKQSSDFERLSRLGNILPYGSMKHKIYLLLADKMISSHSADFARNQLQGKGALLRNLLSFKFIFLQHGITKDDVSLYLNRYNRNIDLFLTASKLEYESILNGDYYYSDNQVKLTGFPRYDNLIDKNKKQIFIIPTWRSNIVGRIDDKTGTRKYTPIFKQSQYFKVYNNLLNDKRLIEVSKKYGYDIKFYPHPEIYAQLCDFEKNESVEFVDIKESYQKLINESSILITDYSSIFFDFAYLKKPVVYYHWDENHYDKGYFDYETMGFGEVCYDYDKLIDTITQYIENNCKMKEEYISRVDDFYEYTDKNNCERVYNEIINMKN